MTSRRANAVRQCSSHLSHEQVKNDHSCQASSTPPPDGGAIPACSGGGSEATLLVRKKKFLPHPKHRVAMPARTSHQSPSPFASRFHPRGSKMETKRRQPTLGRSCAVLAVADHRKHRRHESALALWLLCPFVIPGADEKAPHSRFSPRLQSLPHAARQLQ